MIYTTGSIAGSGNTLTGTGTNFTAAGSLIRNGCTVIALTSPVQILQITGVTSATQLTVTPAVSPAVPAGTRYAILLSDSLSVDGLALDIAETFGMYQAYMGGFADVMTGTGNVTITINGVAVTVPTQKSLAQKDASGGVPVSQGGTGSTTAAGARGNLGITDKQLNSVDGKTGGVITGAVNIEANNLNLRATTPDGGWPFFITFMAGQGNNVPYARVYQEGAGGITIATAVNGTPKYFSFLTSGNATASGSWISNSDERIKDNIQRIDNALDKMRFIKGVTWNRKEGGAPGIGFIAQDVQAVFPDAVFETGSREMPDGKMVEDILAPDTSGVAAALHHEAILALMDLEEKRQKREENMTAFLKTLGYDPDTDYTVSKE